MATIQLIISGDDLEGIKALSDLGDDAVVAKPDHFEGGAEILSAVVQVTSVTLPVIAMLIRERIKANRFIKVKMKGVEVTGASLEEVGKLLKELEAK